MARGREAHGRGGRQALRRQALPARGQGADEGAGRQPDRGLSRGHPDARLDEPRDQARRPWRSSPSSRPRSAIPTSGATTRSWRSAATTWWATSAAPTAFELDRDLAKLGKPVDRDRVGHDAADGQRLLQPGHERDRLPRRDPPAAVLRPERRRRRELRRHRRGDRPRDRPRLRRPGLEVRRRRQHERTGGPTPTARSSRSGPRC